MQCRYLRDCSGSVAYVFALALVPLLGALGIGMDYANAVRARYGLQQALDAAVLAASRVDISNEQRQSVFTTVFNDNYSVRSAPVDSITFSYVAGSGGKADATAQSQTSLLVLLGYKSVPVSAHSSANTDPVNLEIVFALDISGSMRNTDMGGSRLDALKAAATQLIDTIMTNKNAAQSVKFSVLPFSMAVNIGTANVGIVDGSADPIFNGTEWAGCVSSSGAAATSPPTFTIRAPRTAPAAGRPTSGRRLPMPVQPIPASIRATAATPATSRSSRRRSARTRGARAPTTIARATP